MKIQVRSIAIALAIALPMAVTATATSSAAPMNGTWIKAAVPALTTNVRYRVRQGHRHSSNWDYPTYNSYWGYPADSSYWGYPTDNSYSGAYADGYYGSGCLSGPRVGAFATAPWTDTPTCPPH